eukprot:88957_1
MGGKRGVQSVPDYITESVAIILDNSKCSLLAIWHTDCYHLSNVLRFIGVHDLKKTLVGIVMESSRFGDKDTVDANEFIKSVFGRDMWTSVRGLFTPIQTEEYLSAKMEFLFYR